MIDLSLPRLTCSWKLAGTKTFRLSAAALFRRKGIKGIAPEFKGWGTNFTNWEKKLRKYIIADPGMVLCQRDQSGAEALIVAHLAKKGKYRALFDNKIKPHTYVAASLFKPTWKEIMGHSIDDVFTSKIEELKSVPYWSELSGLIKDSDNWPNKEFPKGKRYYYLGKKTCHASNYEMGGRTLATSILKETGATIRLSPVEAQTFIDTYRKNLFPEISFWQEATKERVRTAHVLKNLFGYPRQFFGPFSPECFRDAISWVPQSTVGVITHIAITKYEQFVHENKLNWDVLNCGHDSFLTQCPSDEWEDNLKVMGDCLNQTLLSPWGETFQMKSEGQVGENWAPYDEQYNPTGLKEVK